MALALAPFRPPSASPTTRVQTTMSGQLEFLQSYRAVVDANLAAYPEDEAMARSVGGHYELFGALEHQLLRQLGLGDGAHVVDIGCGAGRLASRLVGYPGIRYSGTDIVPKLLEYTRRKCAARPDFRFHLTDRIEIPAEITNADFVTFFSVFTHLLHEESYVYLEEAARILNPGGKIVVSFLEYAVDHNWGVFMSNVDWVKQRSYLGHINIFMHRDDFLAWAPRLGLQVLQFHSGDDPFIVIDKAAATPDVRANRYAFGQSVCVLTKA